MGCATVDPDRQAAEREAAVARWERCVERHTSADGSWLEAVEAARRHCDGHRRDVAHTFAPHMEARVRHRLAARERADALRARTARRAEATPRLDRLLLRMTDERGNL